VEAGSWWGTGRPPGTCVNRVPGLRERLPLTLPFDSMVLPLLELVPELQALFVALLVDATTAGRLAQASRVCKELLKPRLVALRAGLRLAAQARREELRQRKRAAVLQLFEVVDGGAFYRCMAHVWSGGTPCGKHLHVARSGSLSRLMCHLQQYHADEYRAAMLACDMISLEQR
jgi:hypothetical protein